MSYKFKTLLFIPVYNCEKTVTEGLEKFFFKENEYFFDQVLFIDNQSNDKTILKIKDFVKKIKLQNKKTSFKIFRNKKNYNYGGSNKIAFNYAYNKKFDYLFISSGDNQGFISDLVNIFKKEMNKNRSFFGVRFHNKAKFKKYSKIRIWVNLIINKLFSYSIKMKVNDLGCGQTILNCKYLKDKFYLNFPDGLYFTYYLTLFHILNNKFKIKFVDIRWKHSKGESSVIPFKHIIEINKLFISILFFKKIFFNKADKKKISYYNYKNIKI